MKKLLLLAIPILLAAACGAASASGSTGGGAGSTALAPYRPANLSDGALKAPAGSGYASTAQAGAPTHDSTATAVPPLPSAQHLEIAATVSTQMARDHFEDGLNAVIGIVSSEHGYLASSTSNASGSALRDGSFTFEIPVDNFQDTINRLKDVGKFLGLNTTSKSHDAEYVDLKARLESAQLQLAAYNALLQKATSISDIITIEQQVAQVQQQIEQYQGQLNYLDGITQYSTVTVNLSEKGAPAPAPRPLGDQWGFAASLSQVAHNLAAIGNGLILVVGTLLPFLVLAALAFATRRRWLPALSRP